MFKKVDVIFQVEHKDRELESYKAVANYLKENYEVTSLIISNMFHSYYFYLYKPKLVIWNNLSNNVGYPDGFMWETYKKGIKYISHRWEQNLSPYNFKFKAPREEFEKNEVILFAWDEEFKNYLIEYGVKKKNIKVVGNIANNLLYNMKSQKQVLKNRLSKEFNLNNNKEWIFLPLNFGWAFMSEEAINLRIKNGYDEKIAKEYKEFSQKCLKEFIYFIDKVAKNYDYEIILRPHPSITEANYIKQFKDILGYVPNNLIINKAYSIREWIIASDIIGSNWSTSVWDAYKIGKKSFYFTPYKRPEWLNTYWLDEVINIKSIEEFKAFINSKINYNELDNRDSQAIEKFSKEIVELLPKKYPKIQKFNLKYLKTAFKFFLKDLLCKYFKCKFIQKWQVYDWFDVIKVKNK